jgi:hypothetical protein
MNTPSPVVVSSVSVFPLLVELLDVLPPPLDPPLLPPPLDPPLLLVLLLDALLPAGGSPESVASLPAERVGRAQPTSTVRSGSTTPGAGRPCMVQSL